MGKHAEREEAILSVLRCRSQITTFEAIDLLNVSESTARRLFNDLVEKGKAIRQYGGIRLAQNSAYEYSFERLMDENAEEKQAIANKAVEFISDHDIIFFDSGTTVYRLCLALAEKIKSGALSDITVFTNSSSNLQPLAEVCEVTLVGGKYRPKRMDFAGFSANKFISNFNFTKAFLGTDAVNTTDGFMTTDTDTAMTTELVIERSDTIIVLADAGKIGRRSFMSYAKPQDIDVLVTSMGADMQVVEKLRKTGTKVLTVNPKITER